MHRKHENSTKTKTISINVIRISKNHGTIGYKLTALQTMTDQTSESDPDLMWRKYINKDDSQDKTVEPST